MTTTAPDVRSGTPRRVRWAGRAAAFAVVVLAGWLAWASLGWTREPYERVQQVGPDRLQVWWTGGACDDVWRVDVDESDDMVRLTVRIHVRRGACPAVGIRRSTIVDLDAPLAGRRVVDASCGRAEFADYSVCRTG